MVSGTELPTAKLTGQVPDVSDGDSPSTGLAAAHSPTSVSVFLPYSWAFKLEKQRIYQDVMECHILSRSKRPNHFCALLLKPDLTGELQTDRY